MQQPTLVIALTGVSLLAVLVWGGANSAWAAVEQIPATDWEKELAELDLPKAEVPIHERLSVTLSAGTNACVGDGDETCSRISMGGFGGFGLFFDALPQLQVGLDLRFGVLSPHDDPAIKSQGISTFYMMPTAVWIEPFTNRWQGEGRVGIGYAAQTHSYTGADGATNGNNWLSWLGLNLGVAFSVKVFDSVEAGFGADLYLQDGGTMCTETVASACVDLERDMTDVVQTVLFGRYRL